MKLDTYTTPLRSRPSCYMVATGTYCAYSYLLNNQWTVNRKRSTIHLVTDSVDRAQSLSWSVCQGREEMPFVSPFADKQCTMRDIGCDLLASVNSQIPQNLCQIPYSLQTGNKSHWDVNKYSRRQPTNLRSYTHMLGIEIS